MPRPPHIDRILKLLILSGRNNPSEQERAVAREKAGALMERHGVTLEEMRDLYRREQGLPPRAGAPDPQPDPEEQERLAREARERARRRREEQERSARREAERDQLRTRVRAVLQEAIGRYRDFADFFEHLAGLGIQASMESEEAMERIVYRWPPAFRVSVESADLGPGCDWPALVQAGLRFDPLDLRHREARSMMIMK